MPGCTRTDDVSPDGVVETCAKTIVVCSNERVAARTANSTAISCFIIGCFEVAFVDRRDVWPFALLARDAPG